MISRVSLGSVTTGLKNIFGKGQGKVAKAVAQEVAAPVRMTSVMTDVSTGIVKMEREITYAGKNALATVEKLPNGATKLRITGGGDNPISRTKIVTREKGTSVFGGDRITIEKNKTKNWCYGEKSTLVKEYNPAGALEHKELDFVHEAGNGLSYTKNKAVQDRVYQEHPISSAANDMLVSPLGQKNYKHALNDSNNYKNFADKGTNYSRTIASREQAAIDMAKKAEDEIAAVKLAAEKTAAELKAVRPRINVEKLLNKNIEDFVMKETKLADGTIEKIYTAPNSSQVIIKTQDKGLLHREWIYGGKADMVFMKQVGKDTPYILSKKGDYTQVSSSKPSFMKTTNGETAVWKDQYGRPVTNTIDAQYYFDGIHSYKGGKYKNDAKLSMPYNETSKYKNSTPDAQKTYDSMAKDYLEPGSSKQHRWYQNLDQYEGPEMKKQYEAAQNNYIDLEDSLKGYAP